jgi:hypothetical protein
LDRALLWNELENSWWRSARQGLLYILCPALFVSFVLWLCRLSWWVMSIPSGFGLALLVACWIRDLLVLAREGLDSRTVRSMSEAVHAPAPEPNPPPSQP